jgi:homoserine dehydrogenase
VLNAIQFEGDLVGRVVFEGPGAGPAPTASSVLADVLDVARDIAGGRPAPRAMPYRSARVRRPSEHQSRYYLRLTVADQAGVFAQLGGALGGHGISIASVIQVELDEDAQTAQVVITTHETDGAAIDGALAEIRALQVVSEVGNVLAMAG